MGFNGQPQDYEPEALYSGNYNRVVNSTTFSNESSSCSTHVSAAPKMFYDADKF